jgi:nucleotide-binding universal stress UspA family protein
MILLPYDGSADAQAAIDRVAQLAPGAEATVLTVWIPFLNVLAGAGTGMGMGLTASYGFTESAQIDKDSRDAATATAAEGAQRATAAGLVCTPLAQTHDGDVANTILAVAADLDADVIAMGTRGLSAVKAFMLGSVSHAVVQHADRAVLVVPSPDLVGRRRHQLDRHVVPV